MIVVKKVEVVRCAREVCRVTSLSATGDFEHEDVHGEYYQLQSGERVCLGFTKEARKTLDPILDSLRYATAENTRLHLDNRLTQATNRLVTRKNRVLLKTQVGLVKRFTRIYDLNFLGRLKFLLLGGTWLKKI